jgi:hypothetical protein
MARFCVVARGWQRKNKEMQCNKEPLSFEEIVKGRDASVRVTTDNLIYAVDLAMVVTGKERDYSGQILRTIPNEVFQSGKFIDRQMSNRGGHKTKLLTLDDAILLIMVLPGETAKEVRHQFANIIRRYMAGDKSLVSEIAVNASSNSPIAQMARASLGQEPVADEQLVGLKRRREELELFKLEEEVRGMTQARLKNEEEVRGMTQTRIIAATAEIERIRDPSRSNLDERTRLMIQDTMQNSILNSQAPALGGGGGALAITNGPSPNALISISSVAAKLGYKPDTEGSKRIGMDLRKRYLKQHGKPPPKHDQMCDGRVTLVNSYTEQDRALVEEALHTFFAAAKKQ